MQMKQSIRMLPWRSFGSVTHARAAEACATWVYHLGKERRALGRRFIVHTRDAGSDKEFPHEVRVVVNLQVKPLRGDK